MNSQTLTGEFKTLREGITVYKEGRRRGRGNRRKGRCRKGLGKKDDLKQQGRDE